MKDFCLHTIPLFAILLGRFSAHCVAHSCGGHQVPLISSINKGLAYKCSAIKGFEGNDLVVFLGYTSRRSIQPPVSIDHDLIFPDHVFKCSFSNMGLKQPHGLETGIIGNSSLTLVTKG